MLLAGGLVTLVLLAFGTFNLVTIVAHDESTSTVAFPSSIRHLHLALGGGDVTLIGSASAERDGITGNRTITRGLTSPTYGERVDGDTLTIESSCAAVFNWCTIAYSLTVPPDVAITTDAGSGDVTIRGVVGDVSIDGGSGDVQADDVATFAAHTGSGDITVTGASGPVVLTAGSGEIYAGDLRGPTADVETRSGSILLAFTADPMRVEARASSGDVTVILPNDDAAYRIATATSSGTERVAAKQDPAGERRVSVTTSSGDLVVTQNTR